MLLFFLKEYLNLIQIFLWLTLKFHIYTEKTCKLKFLDGCRKYFSFFLLLPSQSCPASPTCPVSVLSCHYRLSCVSPPSCHTAKKKQCRMDMSLEDVPYYKQYAVMIPKDYIRGLCSKLFLLITTLTTKQQNNLQQRR